jgi:hypothetical protein
MRGNRAAAEPLLDVPANGRQSQPNGAPRVRRSAFGPKWEGDRFGTHL